MSVFVPQRGVRILPTFHELYLYTLIKQIQVGLHLAYLNNNILDGFTLFFPVDGNAFVFIFYLFFMLLQVVAELDRLKINRHRDQDFHFLVRNAVRALEV